MSDVKPVRVQLSRAKGWRMPPNTVKVDRTTRWGNPFRIGEAVDLPLARRWGWKLAFPGWIAPDASWAVRRFALCVTSDEAIHPHIRDQLRGKNLACWCPLDGPCHADVLLELANAPETPRQQDEPTSQVGRSAVQGAGHTNGTNQIPALSPQPKDKENG